MRNAVKRWFVPPSITLFLVAAPLIILSGRAHAQTPQEDRAETGFRSSQTLFATLAAINAAGYDDGLDSRLNERYKLRTQVKEELAKRTIPVLPQLRDFYKAHRKPNGTAELSQYVSFAMIAGGAPDFAVPEQAPADVQALAGFSELLAKFYTEAGVEELWKRSQQAYTAAITDYQEPVIAALFEANGYLRNPSGYLGRRFEIFLDLMGAPDQVQVRSYKDDYFVVITPTTVPVVDEIRDAYLGYLLDPLTFKYSDALKSKKVLQKFADPAPALDLHYKDDWSLLVTKCLIKAIDARLLHEGPEKRQSYINQAMAEGFILTAAFADLLPAYEKQQEALRIYYPDLVNAIDIRKEEKRLKNVQFAQSRSQRVVAAPAPVQLDPGEEALQTADGLLDQKDLPNARKAYQKVLEVTQDTAKKGRAYYGLGVIDLQEKRWDEALNLLEKTVSAKPDPSTVAWAHYYLGMLAMKSGDRDKAGTEFKQTLETQGASMKARQAAEKAMQSFSGENNQ